MDIVKWAGNQRVSADNVADRTLARNLLVADPYTGRNIPHVTAIDFKTSTLEVLSTTLSGSEPGMKMQLKSGQDEFQEIKQYTFLRMVEPETGNVSLLKHFSTGDFDVIDKNNGIVLCESRVGKSHSERVLDPDAYWASVRARVTDDEVPTKLSEVIVGHPDFIDFDPILRSDDKGKTEG